MNASKKHPFLVVLTALLLVLVLGVLSPVQAAPLEYVSDFPPHPILSDLRVRQAMAYCTDKVALVRAVYPLFTEDQAADLVMNTFIAPGSEFYAGDANITIYPYSIVEGKALLETAGWTLAPGADFRTNAEGQELAITFTTTTSGLRYAYASVWEQQMAACGIRITRYHMPASWWFGDTTGLYRRQFELGAFAWVGQADPGGYTLWACDQIPQPSNGWAGQNYMGWCNLLADGAIKTAVNTIDILARKEAYKVVQAQYTQDVPALPLFVFAQTSSTDADLTGFVPNKGEEYYTYNTQDWEIPEVDTIIIGSANEPPSLYNSAYASGLMLYPVNPRSYLSLDYTFTPQLVTQLSTIENGLANNNSVTVDDGDLVVDAGNDVVVLVPGVVVKDSTGTEVEFTGDPIQMKRLVVTYPFRNDLTWSDGTELTIVDFELGYQTACDPENSGYYFYTCDRTLDVTFATDGNNTYTVTYVPGYQDALYFLAPYNFYPAHRIIATPGPYVGWALADVPASAWPTLLELTDDPIGVGPYKIVEWIKGDKIVYAANPHAPADLTPATPNLTIKFIAPQDAVTKLINGEIDLLGWDILGGLTSALVDAETAGIVKNYVIAGATWEHIDMNLNLMQYSIYLPLISQPAP